MFNLKKSGNQLIYADIIKPEIAIATLNDELTERAKEQLTNEITFGIKLLDLASNFTEIKCPNLKQIDSYIENVRNVIRDFEKEEYFSKKANRNND